MIKSRKLANKRFLRQYSVGNFIIDFYCPECKLAIEFDGEVHNTEAQEYDKQRSEFLEKFGVKVLLFENCEVFNNSFRTLSEIEKHLR